MADYLNIGGVNYIRRYKSMVLMREVLPYIYLPSILSISRMKIDERKIKNGINVRQYK